MIITASMQNGNVCGTVTRQRQDGDRLPDLLLERFTAQLIERYNAFYQDPRNEEAYQAWRAKRRTTKEDTV